MSCIDQKDQCSDLYLLCLTHRDYVDMLTSATSEDGVGFLGIQADVMLTESDAAPLGLGFVSRQVLPRI